ncbi:MAG TPA: carboxypeptidase regulatory-like domain-containing protein [Bryobacteraceae bacterium]|nr:carboxypeptidase regulatory-like domain-containing protein [Bryobacteraceae bacterium]
MKVLFRAMVLTVTALGVLFAQGERGAITGLITDPSGAAMPNVEVVARDVKTGVEFKTTTASAGLYRIPYMPPSNYRVTATLTGFKTAIIEPVEVAASAVVTANVTMQVGDVSQSLTVNAEATHLDTSTSQVGYSVSPEEFHAWPLDSGDCGQRQIQAFIFNSLPGAIGCSFQGSINGGPTFSHEVLIDGISIGRADIAGDTAEYTPSVDAVSDFTLQTGALSAQYGGGLTAVANFNIKSGTNQYHGTIYDYILNNALDANSFANNALGVSKNANPFRQNNFGTDFGGPVLFPKLYNGKNKTFVFFSYEGTRTTTEGITALRTLPTSDFKDGNFSSLLNPAFTGNANSGTVIGTDAAGNPVTFGTIYDPHSTTQVANGFVRTPFPGNIIPPTDISKVSAAILAQAPIPNPVLGTFLHNYPGVDNQPIFTLDTYSGKLDHIINANNRVTVFVNSNERNRFNGDRNSYQPIPGSVSGPFAAQDIHGTMVRATEDWTIAAHWLNHFGFGYNRFLNSNNSISLGQDWPSKLGLTGVAETTFPQVTFTGTTVQGGSLVMLGRSNAGDEPNGSYIAQNDTTWIHGTHNFRFGTEIRKYFYNQDPIGNTTGTFTFSPDQTADPSNLQSTGFAFASFLLGAPGKTSQNISPVLPQSRWWNPAFYVTDDWKVSRRLTLNLGFRWDIIGGLYELNHRSSGFDPTLPNPGADGYPGALIFLSQLHRNSFQNTYWKGFGPRAGFAYQISPWMVLRGGYGINYSPPISNGFGLASIDGYDGSNNFQTSKRDPVFYWDNGYPAYTHTLPVIDPTLDNGNGINYIAGNSNRQPYAQNYTLGFQFLLPKNTTLSANYVGNKGTRLDAQPFNNLNQLNPKYLALGDALLDDISQHPNIPLPYPSFTGTVAQALLPYPQYAGGGVISQFPYWGTSHYDSAQLLVTHRTGKGLSFLVAYAFQKTLTDTSAALAYYGYSQDVYNRKLEKSVASFDRPQVLKVTWIYELPFGRGKQFLNHGGVLNQVVGGWTATGIQIYQSGDPLLIESGLSGAGYWFNGDVRGDVLTGVPLKVPLSGPFDFAGGTGIGYLNPAAYAEPPTTPNGVVLRPGTAPHYLGNVRGPRNPTENFGFFKDFPFREGMFFQIRCDLLNAFNRAGLGDPDTNLSDPTFGRILNAGQGPRRIQVAGRFTF